MKSTANFPRYAGVQWPHIPPAHRPTIIAWAGPASHNLSSIAISQAWQSSSLLKLDNHRMSSTSLTFIAWAWWAGHPLYELKECDSHHTSSTSLTAIAQAHNHCTISQPSHELDKLDSIAWAIQAWQPSHMLDSHAEAPCARQPLHELGQPLHKLYMLNSHSMSVTSSRTITQAQQAWQPLYLNICSTSLTAFVQAW